MSEQQYLPGSQEYELELNRLRLLEEIHDPVTIRHLEMLGVSQGWNCLEVGAGAGSMAEWLAKRVAYTGKVVAADIDIRFLRQVSMPNLEIRQHDIMKDDLETGHYDLVHCRDLLMHLPEPEKVVRRMANALRLGGWLLIEEADYGSMLSQDVTNPAAVDGTAMLRATFDFVRKMGITDLYFGRRVRSLVEQLQFIDIGHDGWTDVVRPSDPFHRMLVMTAQVGLPLMVNSGLFTQEQVDSFMSLVSAPDFCGLGSTTFSAWGRRPFGKA
jgi:SAM-dependent methyltransferase